MVSLILNFVADNETTILATMMMSISFMTWRVARKTMKAQQQVAANGKLQSVLNLAAMFKAQNDQLRENDEGDEADEQLKVLGTVFDAYYAKEVESGGLDDLARLQEAVVSAVSVLKPETVANYRVELESYAPKTMQAWRKRSKQSRFWRWVHKKSAPRLAGPS